MKRQIGYMAILFLLFCASAHAQTTPANDLQALLQKLATYGKTYPQEKVYLHLDKPYYAVGDNIWFKAYVTVGQQYLLSAMSRIVYVDLIDPDNQLIRSLRLPVLSGLSMGDFQLTDSVRDGGLREGNYRIRAYTNWMRNFDEDFFFDKTIPVGNALTDKLLTYTDFTASPGETDLRADIFITELSGQPVTNREVTYEVAFPSRRAIRGKTRTNAEGKLQLLFPDKPVPGPESGRINLQIKLGDAYPPIRKTIPIKQVRQKNAIQFFPESGSLLAGITGKVGFKALQPDGKGTAAHGHITDNNGQQVTEFRTGYAGMGYFLLTPEAGKTYTAHVTFADSTTTEAALPRALTSGYALSVNNTADRTVFLRVTTTPAQVSGQTLSVIAQRNGQVYYAAAVKQTKPETGISIDRSGLPSGVIQLTLLDERLNPVAERLLFNLNQRDTLPVVVSADKKTYQPREKVTVKLAAGSAGDSIRVGSFSAVVTDLAKVPVDSHPEDGILPGLLLSPELKGYIETPGYYFQEMDQAKRQQLDNLMLTQGWRRIVWKDLLGGKLPAIQYQPEQGIGISGKAVKKTGTPARKAHITLLSVQDIGSAMDTITDDKGRFNFDRLVFYDSTRLVIQARNEKGKQNVNILLDQVTQQPPGTNRNTPDVAPDINQSVRDYLKNREQQDQELRKYGLMEHGHLLDEVVITTNRRPTIKNSANFLGTAYADQVILGKDLTNCKSLEVCLRAHLRGIVVFGGVPMSMRLGGKLLILVDGMPVLHLSVIPPTDVEAIELILRPDLLTLFRDERGLTPTGGVLVITTKSGAGNFRGLPVTGIVTHTPQGFYATREFYTPDYSQPQEHPGMRDLRSTIHWKPDVTTDENGQALFDFYTADDPGTYRILVEGIDAMGRIARSVSYIEVK